MSATADIGLIGLGVMGQNLALNIADHGYPIVVYNRTPAKMQEFVQSDAVGDRPLTGQADLGDFIATIKRPRAIVLMVQAGAATDAAIDSMLTMLEPGDIVIDGGNAHFPDTIRREKALRDRDLLFLGTGVSGGEEGARYGPSMMAGGAENAYARVKPIFESIAAHVEGDTCCAHVGPDGSGHFVKMLHNGIEYADMQLIAEAYAFMKGVLGMSYPEMQAAFAEWNTGDLDSFLIEITADILSKNDPETGKPMVEIIRDSAGQKGTGRWSVVSALDLGAAAPTMAEAVGARTLSAYKDERVVAATKLAGPSGTFQGDKAQVVGWLRDTLLAGKICAYAQGFAVIAAAGEEYGWDIDFGTLASIWRGGCIIRARFLGRIKEAYERDPKLPNLMLDPYFAGHFERTQAGWREVVALAAKHGVPVPGFASALAYYDGYRSAVLPANLIQAQRDYFGAHTYERLDKDGVFHTEWSKI